MKNFEVTFRVKKFHAKMQQPGPSALEFDVTALEFDLTASESDLHVVAGAVEVFLG